MVRRATMPSYGEVVTRMLSGYSAGMGRRAAGREMPNHRDPERIAVDLLGRARRWEIALRLGLDHDDASMARRGITGARTLAARLLDELREAGIVTGEQVDALLRRHRAA